MSAKGGKKVQRVSGEKLVVRIMFRFTLFVRMFHQHSERNKNTGRTVRTPVFQGPQLRSLSRYATQYRTEYARQNYAVGGRERNNQSSLHISHHEEKNILALCIKICARGVIVTRECIVLLTISLILGLVWYVCGCGGVGGGCIRKYFKLQAGRVLITLTARAML